MRRPVFFACWKSNKRPKEVMEFFEQVHKRGLTLKNKTEVILAPAPVYLEMARLKMPKVLKLGAQDVSEVENGGRMGEVTAKLLKEYGVQYCAVGHREKRERGETDAIVNQKIKLLQAQGIVPMLCVGENWQENQANLGKEVVKKQIQGALVNVSHINDIMICYRPSWTLERGIVPSGDYVNLMAKHIRACLVDLKDNPLDASLPILYGGSVTPANCQEYMKQPEIDGVFFVGAALNIDSFYGVINYDQNNQTK